MRGSFIGFRGCEGPQPSKVKNGDRSSDRDLEGVRSLGAVLVDASFVLPQQAIRTMRGSLLGFACARDRSPPKSRTAIEVLIQTWRASGSLGAVLVDASFVLPQQAMRTMRGSLLGSAAARDRSPPSH